MSNDESEDKKSIKNESDLEENFNEKKSRKQKENYSNEEDADYKSEEDEDFNYEEEEKRQKKKKLVGNKRKRDIKKKKKAKKEKSAKSKFLLDEAEEDEEEESYGGGEVTKEQQEKIFKNYDEKHFKEKNKHNFSVYQCSKCQEINVKVYEIIYNTKNQKSSYRRNFKNNPSKFEKLSKNFELLFHIKMAKILLLFLH